MKKLKWLANNIELILMCIIVVLIPAAMLIQIVARYIFRNSLAWPEEFARYCYIWFMFIGAAYSVKEDSLLRVDALVECLPKKLTKIVDSVILFVVFLVCCYIFYHSIFTVTKAFAVGETSVVLKIPLWFIYSSVPVGFGLVVIRYIQRFCHFVSQRRRKEGIEA